ncbi:MAG: hypothetical protein P4L69_07255 [Desulfosporosinus sp.]|nr:hypothetical protein [Desulfosporosinus sp.]
MSCRAASAADAIDAMLTKEAVDVWTTTTVEGVFTKFTVKPCCKFHHDFKSLLGPDTGDTVIYCTFCGEIRTFTRHKKCGCHNDDGSQTSEKAPQKELDDFEKTLQKVD